MKVKAFLCALIAICSVQTTAITLSDVGPLDIFKAAADLPNSGDATESAWVTSVLGVNVALTAKNDTVSSDWELLSAPDVYGAALEGTPSYYLLKFGTGGTGLFTHYLFENVGSLDFAGIDFSEAGINLGKKINVGRISHITEFSVIKVSEPGVFALLFLGVFGLIVVRLSLRRGK